MVRQSSTGCCGERSTKTHRHPQPCCCSNLGTIRTPAWPHGTLLQGSGKLEGIRGMPMAWLGSILQVRKLRHKVTKPPAWYGSGGCCWLPVLLLQTFGSRCPSAALGTNLR